MKSLSKWLITASDKELPDTVVPDNVHHTSNAAKLKLGKRKFEESDDKENELNTRVKKPRYTFYNTKEV